MTPVFQTITGKVGDCFRACVASVLDLEPIQVPHFYEAILEGEGAFVPSEEQAKIQAWFASRGLYLWDFAFGGETFGEVLLPVSDAHPGAHFILTGRSERGHDHAVVCRDGMIVHDPAGSPSSGFVGPQKSGYYHVVVIGKLV